MTIMNDLDEFEVDHYVIENYISKLNRHEVVLLQ